MTWVYLYLCFYLLILSHVRTQSNFQKFLTSTPSTFGLLIYIPYNKKNNQNINEYINYYTSMICSQMSEVSVISNSHLNLQKIIDNKTAQRHFHYVKMPFDNVRYRFLVPEQSRALVYFSIDTNVNITCEQLVHSFEKWKKMAVGDIGPILSYSPHVYEFYTVKQSYIQINKPDYKYYSNGGTSAAWISRLYLQLYNSQQCPQINRINQIINNTNLCQDIGLNFIVGLLFPEMLPGVIQDKIKIINDMEIYQARDIRDKCYQNFTLQAGYNTIRIINTETIENVYQLDQATKLSIYIRKQQIIQRYLSKKPIQKWQDQIQKQLELEYPQLDNFDARLIKAKQQFSQEQNRAILLAKPVYQQNLEILSQLQYAKKVFCFLINLFILAVMLWILAQNNTQSKQYEKITNQNQQI